MTELGGARLLRLATDAVRVLAALPRVELARQSFGPGVALDRVRASRRARVRRDVPAREDLRRLIRLADGILPGPPNCFRRVLIEVALDDAAAHEKVVFGLRAGLTDRSGHAWLEGAPPTGERYDGQLAL